MAAKTVKGEHAMPPLVGFYARPLSSDRTQHQSSFRWMALLIPAALAMAAGPAALADEAPLADVKATASIESCADEPQFLGVATLREEASEEGIKQVSVVIQITEPNRVLAPGKHAVHIHEFGQCEPCADAGGHFDPGPFGFSSPDGNHPYHSGDLVNLGISGNGQGFLRTETSRVTLSPGPLSLFDEDGSALIVHVDLDTYCPEGEVAGCAGGARAACGIIELAD
jgi:superoxide dismutase, Cu-Zn family